MSPLRYQKWLRLNEVRRPMLNEHYDVTTAAYAVGYESYPISVGNGTRTEQYFALLRSSEVNSEVRQSGTGEGFGNLYP